MYDFLIIDGDYWVEDFQVYDVNFITFLISHLENSYKLKFREKFWYTSLKEKENQSFMENLQKSKPNPQCRVVNCQRKVYEITNFNCPENCCSCCTVEIELPKGLEIGIASKLTELCFLKRARKVVLIVKSLDHEYIVKYIESAKNNVLLDDFEGLILMSFDEKIDQFSIIELHQVFRDL